ncbi:hypothetical protein PIB30_073859, partial [Stylosanthes scabra]|nr:hypothetical protein [Stylosanthes scabra]
NSTSFLELNWFLLKASWRSSTVASSIENPFSEVDGNTEDIVTKKIREMNCKKGNAYTDVESIKTRMKKISPSNSTIVCLE